MIYNKDYRDIIKGLDKDKTLIITDPPYNVGWKYDTYKDKVSDDDYGDKDFKILDTHLGSGSSAIASFYFGCKEFVGMEIDEYYYDKSIKRIKQQTAQIKLF